MNFDCILKLPCLIIQGSLRYEQISTSVRYAAFTVSERLHPILEFDDHITRILVQSVSPTRPFYFTTMHWPLRCCNKTLKSSPFPSHFLTPVFPPFPVRHSAIGRPWTEFRYTESYKDREPRFSVIAKLSVTGGSRFSQSQPEMMYTAHVSRVQGPRLWWPKTLIRWEDQRLSLRASSNNWSTIYTSFSVPQLSRDIWSECTPATPQRETRLCACGVAPVIRISLR